MAAAVCDRGTTDESSRGFGWKPDEGAAGVLRACGEVGAGSKVGDGLHEDGGMAKRTKVTPNATLSIEDPFITIKVSSGLLDRRSERNGDESLVRFLGQALVLAECDGRSQRRDGDYILFRSFLVVPSLSPVFFSLTFTLRFVVNRKLIEREEARFRCIRCWSSDTNGRMRSASIQLYVPSPPLVRDQRGRAIDPTSPASFRRREQVKTRKTLRSTVSFCCCDHTLSLPSTL